MKTLVRILLFASLVLSGTAACHNPLYDEPPLHDAAKEGRLSKLKKLIKEGSNVNALNNEGATALHWAAFKGNVEIARYLLRKGAKVNARTNKGNTPLQLAVDHKQEKMIKFLKQRGGNL